MSNRQFIPAELIARPQWVCWRWETRDGKPTKVPYQANSPHRHAAVDDPTTWGRYEVAVQVYDRSQGNGHALDGIGFVLSPNDPYTGVDLDKCFDPDTGKSEDWALEILSEFNSYTEITPSGKGFRIWTKGTLPPGGRHKRGLGKNGSGGLEMYDSGRFFTVTGDRLPNKPGEIRDCQAALEALHARTFPRIEKPAPSPPRPASARSLGDSELLNRAFAAKNGAEFRALWNGDTSAHGDDHSAADLALCTHLLFWSGGDVARADRLFRQSGLMRPKWDRKHSSDGRTYGALTLSKAESNVTDFYQEKVKRQSEPPERELPPVEVYEEDWTLEEGSPTPTYPPDKLREKHGEEPSVVDLSAWCDVDGLEEKVWKKVYQVEGLIEAGRIYEFFGQWKEGKTLALLDMLAHASLGMDWAGRRTTPSLVLYVASEAPEDVKRRLAAWRVRNGIRGPMPFLIREKPVHLDNAQFAGQLAAEVAEIRKRCPELSVMLAIDTVARSLSPGAEENGAGLSAFINNLIDLVARPTGATAIVVHHSGHGDKDRSRGWSGMPAALDGDFKVSKSADDPPIFTVECKFLRNGGKTGKMAFRLETVELLGQDNFENKIIEPVIRYLPDGAVLDSADELSNKAQAILAVFEKLHAEFTRNLAEGDIPSTPRVTRKDLREACKSPPKNFPKNFPKLPKFACEKTFSNWFSEGCLELGKSGKLIFKQGYVLPGENTK